MFVDTLTLAGFLSAASFLLMPLLMGREFIRVQTGDEPRARSTSSAIGRPRDRSPLLPLPATTY